MLRGTAYDPVKRALDTIIGVIALALSAPLQVVVALFVRKQMGTPVLFRQERPGKDAEPFTLLKFRTMVDVDEGRGLITDEERLTRLGRTLRATSLDELPSILNVVRGDLSLVGPRPLLMRYLPRYSDVQWRRHEVRPGLTGLAQVSGRNSLSWEEKFALDVEYVDARSLMLDLRILGRTVVKVLRREGISAAGDATMPEFMGSQPA